MHKREFVLENKTHEILQDFEIQTDHLIPARKSDLVIFDKKSHLLYTEWKSKKAKRDKYLDLAKELKTVRNKKIAVIPVVIGALEKLPKGLERRLKESEISGQIETIQTTTLQRSARILRRHQKTWGDLLSLNL